MNETSKSIRTFLGRSGGRSVGGPQGTPSSGRSRGAGAVAAALLAAVVCALLISAFTNSSSSPHEASAGDDPRQTVRTAESLVAGAVVIRGWANEHGRLPSSERGDALLRQSLLADPWSNELRYELTAELWRVTSAGPDGAFGTADDVLGRSYSAQNDLLDRSYVR